MSFQTHWVPENHTKIYIRTKEIESFSMFPSKYSELWWTQEKMGIRSISNYFLWRWISCFIVNEHDCSSHLSTSIGIVANFLFTFVPALWHSRTRAAAFFWFALHYINVFCSVVSMFCPHTLHIVKSHVNGTVAITFVYCAPTHPTKLWVWCYLNINDLHTQTNADSFFLPRILCAS